MHPETPGEMALNDWLDEVAGLEVANRFDRAAAHVIRLAELDESTAEFIGTLFGHVGAVLRERANPGMPSLTVVDDE